MTSLSVPRRNSVWFGSCLGRVFALDHGTRRHDSGALLSRARVRSFGTLAREFRPYGGPYLVVTSSQKLTQWSTFCIDFFGFS